MNDTLLIQSATGLHAPLLTLTMRDHVQYCTKWSLDYWPIFGSGLTKADGDRHAFWDKIKLILRGVEAGYERVIWLDADCYIADDGTDLREACPVDGLGMVWHGKERWHEHPDCYDHFNAGAIYCSAGPEARRLLKCWWQAKDDGHFWHDQHALNKNAIPAYEALFRKPAPVHKIGLEWNAVPFQPFNHDSPIVAAWHGYQVQIDLRFEAMQEFIRGNTLRRMLAKCSVEEALQKADFCMGAGQFDTAIAFFERAEELGAGTTADFYYRYAHAYTGQQRHVDALPIVERALAVEPENGLIWQFLGMCYDVLGEHELNGEAIEKAQRFCPGFPPLMHNVSLWKLRDGQWAEGFRLMEWSYLCRERIARYPGAEWDGLPVDALLVWAEQGLGDTLMLARYVPLAVEEGSAVLLEVQKPLLSLLQAQCWPGVEVVARPDDNSLPWTFDAHVGMFTLPARIGASVENTIGTPYLKAPAEQVEQWRERLMTQAVLRGDLTAHQEREIKQAFENISTPGSPIKLNPAKRIGFSWAGSAAHGNNHNRNMQAGHFDALTQTPGTRWYSLQRDIVIDDAMKAENPHITWIGDDFEDMAETAGALANLDLVITIDSAIAHLCGALGVPCWVLLSKSSDWRWLLNKDTTVWYDSLRLFRQPTLGDWDSVVSEVEGALKELLSNGN